MDRKQVQEKIRLIYEIVVDEDSFKELQIDEMLSAIVKKLKNQSYHMIRVGFQQLQQSQARNMQTDNILANHKMVESKV